jgi:two-component SAPR family response regulator
LRLGNYPTALMFYQELLENRRRESKQLSTKPVLLEKNIERQASLLMNLGSVYYYQGQVGKCSDHYRQSLELKRKSSNTFSLIYSLVNLGTLYQEIGDYHESLVSLKEALLLIQTHHPSHPMHTSGLGNLGNTFLKLGDYSQALEFNFKSLKISEEVHDKLQIANSLENLGNCFLTLGDGVAALGFFKRSLRIAEEIGNHADNTSTALRGISKVYASFGNFLTAIDYEFRSLRICEITGYKNGQAESYLHLGMFYSKLGSHTDALKYLLLCRQLRQTLRNPAGEATALKYLGEIYYKLHDMDIAIGYLKQANALAGSIELPHLLADCRLTLAELWLSEGKYTFAEKEAQLVMPIAERLQNKPLLSRIHKFFSDIYRDTKRWELSSKHRELYESLERELFSEEAVIRAKKLMAELDIERIEKELGMTVDETKILDQGTQKIYKPNKKIKIKNPKRITVHPLMKSSSQSVLTKVSVKTFGRFSVTIGERELEQEHWKRKKARDVFKMLLLNYGQSVSTDTLIDNLWQDVDVKNAEALVMNAISQVRKALSLYAPSENFIKSTNRAYVLDFGKAAEIDFLNFKSFITKAALTKSTDQIENFYQEAVSIYRGEFLREDLFEEWSSFERESLKESYLNAMQFLASSAIMHDRVNESMILARTMLEHDKIYEPAYKILFAALRKLNLPNEAQKVFHECKVAFNHALNIAPPKALVDMLF